MDLKPCLNEISDLTETLRDKFWRNMDLCLSICLRCFDWIGVQSSQGVLYFCFIHFHWFTWKLALEISLTISILSIIFLKIQKKFLQDSYMYIRTEYLFVAVGLKYMLNQNWNVTCKVKSEVKNIYSCEIINITFIVQNLGPRTSYWQAQWGAW